MGKFASHVDIGAWKRSGKPVTQGGSTLLADNMFTICLFCVYKVVW